MDPAEELRDLLAAGEELTIVCHNNPDPDCLASAFALGRIAVSTGIDEHRILYSGQISHQQNRAFVNLLNIDLQPFEADAVKDREEGSLLALVDHAVPGANNEVPAETPIDIVIDHHPNEDIEARFIDHRVDIGSTATILTEYVRTLDIEVDTPLATGLLFAIRRETLGFLRGTTPAEYQGAGFLHSFADQDLLRTLSTPSVTGGTVDAIADAISNRTVRGSVLLSGVGRTSERDALPQAADYLATLEGVDTAIVFGIIEDSIQLSARSSDPRIHIGDILASAFDDVGSAGGHREMAGGEVPLGIIADFRDDDTALLEIVDEVMTARLVAAMNLPENGGESDTAEDA